MAINSCLVYPGGKRKAASLIMDAIPYGVKDWREPFFGGGSGSIAFLQSDKSKDCTKFVVGDLYSEVWAFWKGIQSDPYKVLEYCHEFFYRFCKTHDEAVAKRNEEEYEELYEKAIEEGNAFWEWSQTVDTTKMNLYERAARFFIVNRISFSAMSDSGTLSKVKFMEFSLQGRTPYLLECSQVIQRLEIINAPFQETMANVTKDTFVFLDPPYIAQEGSGLYGKKGSTHKGFPHQALADMCRNIPCKWLMTIDDSIASRKLYAGMEINPFHLSYTLASKASEDALAGEEIFISNYKIREEEDSYDTLSSLL